MTDSNGGAPPVYTVGGEDYVIRPFKGSKGVRAFAVLSRLGDRMRPIMEADAEFVRTYSEVNVQRVTRGMGEFRRSQAQADIRDLEIKAKEVESVVPEEDTTAEDHEAWRDATKQAIALGIEDRQRIVEHWTRQLEGPLKEMDHIEIPREPAVPARIANVMMLLWNVAEPEMTMLLGLALIDDKALKEARGTPDGAEKAIRDLGLEALDDLYIDQCGEVILSALEVAAARMQSKAGELGNRARALWETWAKTRARATETEDEEQPRAGTVESRTFDPDAAKTQEDQPTSPGGSETSSTPSPTDTDGTPTESSSENSGTTSPVTAS